MRAKCKLGLFFLSLLLLAPFCYAVNKQHQAIEPQFFIETPGSLEVYDQVLNILKEYNESKVGPYSRLPFMIYAKDNGKVIAGVIGIIRPNHDCFIDSVAVDKNYRGQGIGSKILAELDKLARSKNCKIIIVDTAEFQAKDFYAKQGYVQVAKVKRGFLGYDYYIMKKDL